METGEIVATWLNRFPKGIVGNLIPTGRDPGVVTGG